MALRIIAWVNKDSGVCYHRLIAPLMLMQGVEVFITNNLLDEHFEKGCDLFIYNRIIEDDLLLMIRERQKKYGFKVCVDVDDFWILDEHHILYEEYQLSNFAGRQVKQLQDADAVLVTHERLRAEVLPYNRNVFICPNAIPKKGQFDIEREPHYQVRLFWQGSDTHKADVALLKTPILNLAPIAKDIRMIMAGYAENHDDWHQMVKDYTGDLRFAYKLISFAKVTDYYKAYAEADICLIPLINSKFNTHKSNLKVLEAANLGLSVIASKVNPYLDMPLLYAKCSADWVGHIRRLVKSSKRRRDAGLELQDFCNTHYNFEKINKERKQILEHAITLSHV